MIDHQRIIAIFEAAALEAGSAILEVYHQGPEIRLKGDNSPVTEADERAEAIILKHLRAFLPDFPVIAEEQVAAGLVPQITADAFILVDPLDGTREFIARHDDFTVNIALIEKGQPVVGYVYAPALGMAYAGRPGGAEKQLIGPDFSIIERLPVETRTPQDKICALVSRSHNSAETQAYIEANAIHAQKAIGSSLKFCLLAEGLADIYPRFSRTMEWDTAAGDAVLRAAGGKTLDPSGHPLTYGKRNRKNEVDFANSDFIAWAKAPSGG